VVNVGRDDDTKHHKREVPIVPRLAEILFTTSQEDDLGGKVCKLRVGNLFREFRALCGRAGLAPWSTWCHSLRKACETDWARDFPLHVVSAWLGHSPKVAISHYLRPTDADFDRAAGKIGNSRHDPAKASDCPILMR
jgi:integrase